MPPRKKARISRAASPEPTAAPKSPTPVPDDTSSTRDEQLLADPWTDEEEIGLFKGLMRWKPTGIHKHFHLLSLHAWLLDHGHIHPRSPHTRPAGIWAKLRTLYDLSALDAREDARQLPPPGHPASSPDFGTRGSAAAATTAVATAATDEPDDRDSDADAYSEAANRIDGGEFRLPPDAGFEEMMWTRRFPGNRIGGRDRARGRRGETAPDHGSDGAADGAEGAEEGRESSPPVLPELNFAEEPPVDFTPSFSVEERAPVKRGRGRRKKADKEREERELREREEREGKVREKEGKKPSRRSARKAELAAGVEAEGGDEEEEGVQGGEEEEGEDEEDGEGDEEESPTETPAPRPGRGTKRKSAAQTRSSRRSRR